MKAIYASIVVLIASVSSSLANDWSGLYGGVHLGGEWDNYNIDIAAIPGFKTNGLSGGFQFIDLYQTRYPIALGVLADLDISSIKGTTNLGVPVINYTRDLKASLRGVVGYTGFDGWMPYFTGGLALSKNSAVYDVVGTYEAKQFQLGYVVGIGAMYSLAKYGWINTFVYGEFLKYEFPTQSYAITAGFNFPTESSERMFKLGFNYKF